MDIKTNLHRMIIMFRCIYLSTMMWYPIQFASMISRWVRYYMTYTCFRYRCFKLGCDHITDSRFCLDDKAYFFPMKSCSDIVCYNGSQEVKLCNSTFENLRTIGVEGDNSLYLNTIKVFCLLPENITKIHCVYYPWEEKSQKEFVITDSSVFVPKDLE